VLTIAKRTELSPVMPLGPPRPSWPGATITVQRDTLVIAKLDELKMLLAGVNFGEAQGADYRRCGKESEGDN
jgi:hypothetical protein